MRSLSSSSENGLRNNTCPTILMLSSIYPAKDIPKSFTPVVHYFVKEWVRMGAKVIVVHNIAYYPMPFYFAARYFNKLINSLTGTTIPTIRYSKDLKYEIDGVDVYRMPMYKKIPHARFSDSVYEKQKRKILGLIKTLNFKPDIIIGHWTNPQLKLLSELKNETGARTCLVMHDKGNTIPILFPKNYQSLLDKIDVWGFRSEPIKKEFLANFKNIRKAFLCYSGIPLQYGSCNQSEKFFSSELKSFAFVGQLIKRKYPVCLIDSLLEVYPKREFVIKYVGQGNELSKIKNRIKRYSLKSQVLIHERLDRETVQKLLCDIECFIMISRNEAYGLVYLEAMAAGCITIASRNEGFDGIIKHGVNGFLCEAGNTQELTSLIKNINQLSIEERRKISIEAQRTAKEMSDSKCAENYIYNVFAE